MLLGTMPSSTLIWAREQKGESLTTNSKPSVDSSPLLSSDKWQLRENLPTLVILLVREWTLRHSVKFKVGEGGKEKSPNPYNYN